MRDGTAAALADSLRLLAEAVVIEATTAISTNLQADREQWGTDLDPILHTARPGTQFAEYALTLPRAGRWRLEIRYASEQARPLRVLWDGGTLAESALGEETGGFKSEHQRWFPVGEWEAGAGLHTLRLEGDSDVPHVSRLLILPADRAMADLDLGALLAAGDVRAYAAVTARAGDDDALWAPWRAASLRGLAALNELRARLAADTLALNPAAAAVLLAPQPDSLEELAARYQVALAATACLPIPVSDAERQDLVPASLRADLAAAHESRAALERGAPAPLPRVMTVIETGAPQDLRILHRGDHLTPRGAPVPRSAPRAASFEVAMAPAPAGASGRLELARWTVDPRNPLAARVMVNRIWQHHFGRGLVATASNFGARGEAPTHLALLDRLATEFVASGWSVKEMHRLLLRSSVWRMSCAWDAGAAAADPANRLLWRREARRLDAEEVRDALLLVSGRLDRTMGGSLLLTKNGEYVNNDQSANLVDYAQPRRSIYLPVVRNAIFEVFSIFDFNDPSTPIEARPRTTVAHQALFAANAPLVRECAAALALRARASETAGAGLADGAAPPAHGALTSAFRAAWQRDPRPHEIAAAGAWLTEEAARSGEDEAWIRFAQALLMANEFYMLD